MRSHCTLTLRWLALLTWATLPAIATAATASSPASPPGPSADAAGDWRRTVMADPTPGQGCFEADYPTRALAKTGCGTPREAPPIRPREQQLVRPSDESTTGDYALISTQAIASASGSLRAIENNTSVFGFAGNTKGCAPGQATCPVADEFNLQLNTQLNLPGTAICQGSTNSACRGWLQFVYDSGGSINIQSWAINYGVTCPANYNLGSGPQQSCGQKTASFTLPFQPLLRLPALAGASLTGRVFKDNAGAIVDQVSLEVGGKIYAAQGTDIAGALGNWKTAQFNLYGNSGGDKSILNSGTLVSVALNVNNSAGGTVSCSQLGASNTTGESTNLTVMPCTATNTPAPSNQHGIAFNEGVLPVIASVSPPGGPSSGGSLITLTASTTPAATGVIPVVNGFDPNVLISFGGSPASGVTCSNTTTASSCNARSPSAHGGNVTLGVTATNLFRNGTPGPTSAPVQFQYFTVTPPPPLKNCEPCISSNRQCIKVAGGFQCKGTAQ